MSYLNISKSFKKTKDKLYKPEKFIKNKKMEAYLETPERNKYSLPQGELVVGRACPWSKANIQLEPEYATEHTSRRHCILYNDGHQVMIADLRSSNGTYVNGDKIERGKKVGEQTLPGKKVPLEHGDILTLGSFEVEFIDQEILDSKPKPKMGLLDFLFKRG